MGKLAKRQPVGEIEKYDPAQGLVKRALAKAAEEYYLRAKDITNLCEAIEKKLIEQQRLIRWFDQTFHGGKVRGRGGDQKSNDRPVVRLPEGFPESEERSRWRRRLSTDDVFAETLATAKDRAVQLVEFRLHRGTKTDSTENPEWYTPEEYLAAVRDVLGEIDLDPASSDAAQQRVRATRYFTKRENGLRQEWRGRVFLNPPYTHPALPEFVGKLVAEVRAERVSAAILLTHNYSDTEWYHIAVSACAGFCGTRGRVKFLDVRGNEAAPTQGQTFFYYGTDRARFFARFRQIGFVAAPQ